MFFSSEIGWEIKNQLQIQSQLQPQTQKENKIRWEINQHGCVFGWGRGESVRYSRTSLITSLLPSAAIICPKYKPFANDLSKVSIPLAADTGYC